MARTEPERFLRGVLTSADWAEGSRLPAAANLRLPVDTVKAGRVPAGVHLAFTGSASAIDLGVTLGTRTSVPAPTLPEAFVARSDGVPSVLTPIPTADGVVRVELPARGLDSIVRVYLPEAVETRIDSLAPVGGDIEPASRGPLWVAYGDSITQGWSISEPGLDWPSLVADALGLDVVNLGFAGSARGELLAADAIGGSGAAGVAIAWGTNAWSALPTDEAEAAERMRLFLTVVRQGLPDAPIVVVSPIVRPDAEDTPNRFGVTQAALRGALEAAVLRFAEKTSDDRITLVPGRDLVPAEQLVDGIHPGDAGQASIAVGVLPHVAAGLEEIQR